MFAISILGRLPSAAERALAATATPGNLVHALFNHNDFVTISITAMTTRRNFLADIGMGFTGLALGSMLHAEKPNGMPHFAPKAKRVIWLFMIGGVSHMESFDPKAELNKYAGRLLGDTPYHAALENPLVKQNLREVIAGCIRRSRGCIRCRWVFRSGGRAGSR